MSNQTPKKVVYAVELTSTYGRTLLQEFDTLYEAKECLRHYVEKEPENEDVSDSWESVGNDVYELHEASLRISTLFQE